MNAPTTTQIAVLRIASRKAGSENSVKKLPSPTNCGMPIPTHSVALSTMMATSGIAKKVVTSNSAGSRYKGDLKPLSHRRHSGGVEGLVPGITVG